jgi:creatinine amidohydrolase/Fe(II)-dependent formamide hydrolase-like protein
MLAVDESLVDMTAAHPAAPDVRLSENISYGYSVKYKGVPMFLPVDDYASMQPGNLGLAPVGANAEVGRQVLEAYIDFNVGLVGELRTVEINEK